MLKSSLNIFTALILLATVALPTSAAELAGIHIDDEITATNAEKLILNGMGLREKLWIDVYVGSLYLGKKANTVAEVLSQPGALSIRMDFVYKEVTSKKLIKAWKDGFEKNQSAETLKALQSRIEQFYSFFEKNAIKGDTYIIDYTPEQGSLISKNDGPLGTIEGEDFKNALVEIWLGNYPADKGLKKGMLGH